MILKKFEKVKLIIFIGIILLLIEVIMIFVFYSIKISTYKKYSAIIFSNNLIYIMIDDKDIKDIYKNKKYYIDNKNNNLVIDHINRKVLKRDDSEMDQVFIKYKSNNRDNEVIDIVLLDDSINVLEMFYSVWKEDA